LTANLKSTICESVPGAKALTRTNTYQKISAFIESELIEIIRAHVLDAIERVNEADFYTQGTFSAQRGIRLADIPTPALSMLAGQLGSYLGKPCNFLKSSARQQFPTGQYKLPWHQDGAPMGFYAAKTGMVAWVPLDDIDGSRPSLEIADDAEPMDHIEDERMFLEIPNMDFKGQVIPNMKVGDVLLFSPYAPHRTFIAPEMTNPRLSLDMRFSNEWGV
jgi:hypothetical protein